MVHARSVSPEGDRPEEGGPLDVPADAARAPGRAGVRWWIPALALGAFLPATGLLVGVLGGTTLWYGFFDGSDLLLYRLYALAMDKGLRPFVDFPAEYPPLAMQLFAFPGHPSEPMAYQRFFAALMLMALAGASVAVVAAAARLWDDRRRAGRVAVAFALSLLATGAIVGNRFDAAVALLLACALWAMAHQRWNVAAFALGLGTALKLVPAVLLPLVLLLAPGRRERVRALGLFALAVATPYLSMGLAALRAMAAFVRYHGARPLQLESVPGAPLLLGHLLGLSPVTVGSSHRSQFIDAPGAPLLAKLVGPLGLLLLALVYALAWRRRQRLRADPAGLALASTGILLALLVSSKVLSPQFLIWLMPCAALLAADALALPGLLAAVFLLTQIEFPDRYLDLMALQPAVVGVVVARNLGLVVALGWVLVRLSRLERPDGAGA